MQPTRNHFNKNKEWSNRSRVENFQDMGTTKNVENKAVIV